MQGARIRSKQSATSGLIYLEWNLDFEINARFRRPNCIRKVVIDGRKRTNGGTSLYSGQGIAFDPSECGALVRVVGCFGGDVYHRGSLLGYFLA